MDRLSWIPLWPLARVWSFCICPPFSKGDAAPFCGRGSESMKTPLISPLMRFARGRRYFSPALAFGQSSIPVAKGAYRGSTTNKGDLLPQKTRWPPMSRGQM